MVWIYICKSLAALRTLFLVFCQYTCQHIVLASVTACNSCLEIHVID